MNDQNLILVALSNFSTTREKILHHRFIAEVTSCLWAMGIYDFSVSHSEVDNSGYDLIIEVGTTIRHIQLKASHTQGAAREVAIQLRLKQKPAGCVVWMIHDAQSMAVEGLLFFGHPDGEALPPLGDKVAKHSKANMLGEKGHRPALRKLPRKEFTVVPSWQALTALLFPLPELGSPPAAPAESGPSRPTRR